MILVTAESVLAGLRSVFTEVLRVVSDASFATVESRARAEVLRFVHAFAMNEVFAIDPIEFVPAGIEALRNVVPPPLEYRNIIGLLGVVPPIFLTRIYLNPEGAPRYTPFVVVEYPRTVFVIPVCR